MAKPATEMRLARAAEGFTEVIGRGNAHIITRNPVTKKCCYDGQVGGGWHYNGDQETDTAWEQDAVAEYLKMVKAGYNLRARKLFNAGDLIQWTDPISGQYVKFQPQNFQWIDGTTGSNSLISVAQAVASPSIDDDKLLWPAAFGAGRHFRYTAAPTKLIKHLIIDSAANIPACPTWITNPWLELTFTLTPSSGVNMYVDGALCGQSTAKTTANAIEFRLPSGEVVWSMAAPLAYDSSEMGEPCVGIIKLYINKKVKYCSVRFPKSWIDSAVFPVVFDPTIEKITSASRDDGTVYVGSGLVYSGTYGRWGSSDAATIYRAYVRFIGISIARNSTIDVAYLTFTAAYNGSSDMVGSSIKIEDSDNAETVSSEANYNSKTWIGSVGWDTPSWVQNYSYQSPSIISLVQSVVDKYTLENAAMQFTLLEGTNPYGYRRWKAYDWEGNVSGPKLHIEYTEAASGNPFYAYAQQ